LAVVRSFTYSLLFYSAANLIMAFQVTQQPELLAFHAGLGIGVELGNDRDVYLRARGPSISADAALACEQAVGFMAVPW